MILVYLKLKIKAGMSALNECRLHECCLRLTRRLSGKKSARGADLGTSQSLLRVEHYGLRDRQMAVIESCSEVED
jgi:hypothetical protein